MSKQRNILHLRKPEPGSEELFYIDNPVEVLGDIELEKVFALIKVNSSGAAGKLKKLKDNLARSIKPATD